MTEKKKYKLNKQSDKKILIYYIKIKMYDYKYLMQLAPNNDVEF